MADVAAIAQGLLLALELVNKLAHSNRDDALDRIKTLTTGLLGKPTGIEDLNPEHILNQITDFADREAKSDADIDRKIAEKFKKKPG